MQTRFKGAVTCTMTIKSHPYSKFRVASHYTVCVCVCVCVCITYTTVNFLWQVTMLLEQTNLRGEKIKQFEGRDLGCEDLHEHAPMAF